MTFPLLDRVTYYASQTRYWLVWRVKNVLSLKTMLLKKVVNNVSFFVRFLGAADDAFFILNHYCSVWMHQFASCQAAHKDRIRVDTLFLAVNL
jgi:hypothetical protein